MATQPQMQPYFLGRTDGRPPFFVGSSGTSDVGGGEAPQYKEAASQTFKAGQLVYIDSNGLVAIVTDSTNKVDSAILGIAMRDATGTTNAPVYVRTISPFDRYVMNVFHSTLASSVTNQNQLQDVFGIIKNGSPAKFYVDIENTTTEDATTALAKVRVVDFPKGTFNGTVQAIGDTHGLVVVEFLEFTIATDGSPFTRNLQYR